MIAIPHPRVCPRKRGLSLVDAIASLVILSAVTVPIATGVASMSQGSLRIYRATAARSELVYEAERFHALPFADAGLAVGTTVTSISLPGGASDLTTVIALADYDGDASVDTAFKLIVLTLDGREIRFYRSDWKE